MITLGLILLGAVILLLIHAILYYRAYKFHVDKDKFVLNKGYIKRKILTIPIERIQNVKTSQSVLQQFLKVMSIEIDTAGTAKKELKIHALNNQMAAQLARELSTHLESHDTLSGETSEEASVQSEETILRLSNKDLLKIGLSQNHIKTALLLFALSSQLFYKAEEYFEDRAKEYSEELWQYLSQSGWILIAILASGFILLSFIYSMIRTLVLYYDLRLLRQKNTYRIASGLLTRKNLLIPFNKIQQINWETGPIKKLFGIYRLNIKQASPNVETKAKMAVVPGCLNKHIEQIKTDLFGPDLLIEQQIIHSEKIYFKRNWIFSGWIPFVLISPIYFVQWTVVFPALLWLILSFFYSRLTLKKSYFQVNNDQIRVSSGAISSKFKQMEFHKVQHMEFRQSIFLKKKKVGSLKIGNASGSILLPFIDEDIARSLYDYLLYYAETSKKSWM